MSAAQQGGEQGLMALFTATPQLKAWEAGAACRDARIAEREHRMQIYRRLLAAYHTSCAKGMLAVNERMAFGIDDPDAIRMDAEHELAAIAMVELLDQFMRLPHSTKNERTERQKLLRKLVGGVGGASSALSMWRKLEPEWQRLLGEAGA